MKTLGTTKRTHVGDIVKSDTIVEHYPSIRISGPNTKRWISLKKRMGFASDDDLAVHLLDLAENDVRYEIHFFFFF